jgi:murein L,D-transpeptidase YcbB/YkuD
MRTEGEPKADEVENPQANMERWRWMPPELGSTHVWLNIPEFTASVVKDGKTIEAQNAVVGASSSPTPSLSANLTSIEFNPYREVPTSVVRRKILPALKKDRSWGGRGKVSVLEQYELEIKHKGKTVDPRKIDWEKTNLAKLKFVQAPGPKNPMGKVQFVFPNARDINLRAAINTSVLNRDVRSVGPSSPRVGRPDKLAAAVLAEDKGWKPPRIAKLIADGKNAPVKLRRPIPIHITYFTMIADDQGNIEEFTDIYDLDDGVTAAIQEGVASDAMTAAPVPLPPRSPKPETGLSTRSP